MYDIATVQLATVQLATTQIIIDVVSIAEIGCSYNFIAMQL